MKTVTYNQEAIEKVIALLNSVEVRGLDNFRLLCVAGDLLRAPVRNDKNEKEVRQDGDKNSDGNSNGNN